MPLCIHRLAKEHRLGLQHFDCGAPALNDYLHRYALTNQEKMCVGVTYVAVDDDVSAAVLGYHTLATTSILKSSFAKNIRQTLSPHATLPAILLGRLAVDRKFHNRGIGGGLLRHAFELSLKVRREIGCRCLVVDAYPSAIQWYQRFGLVTIGDTSGATQKMYIDLRTIAASVGE